LGEKGQQRSVVDAPSVVLSGMMKRQAKAEVPELREGQPKAPGSALSRALGSEKEKKKKTRELRGRFEG